MRQALRSAAILLFAALTLGAAAFGDTLGRMRQEADAGNPRAQFALASLYESGFDTVAPDTLEAARLYRLSAEGGFAPAMNLVAFQLLTGQGGFTKDTEEGLRWLTKAADAGDPKAAFNIGSMLLEGNILEKDETKALEWIEKSAAQGLPVALSTLGDLYRYGRGVEADREMADSLYREAFDRGLPDAGFKLYDLNAHLYEEMTDSALLAEGKYFYMRYAPSEGVKLFYLAAERGNADALALLGDAYSRAVGVPYDYNLSNSYYIRAALKGNPSAQFVVGEMLEIFPDALKAFIREDGDTEEIPDDPAYWYGLAAEAGVTDADIAARRLLE